MVARHGKLGQFFLEPEAYQGVLDGKLITEAESVVVEAETHLHDGGFGLGGVVHTCHGAYGLLEGHQHLVVMVADL